MALLVSISCCPRLEAMLARPTYVAYSGYIP